MLVESNETVLRRRGSTLETALLDAAWEELKAVGYKNLTFDNVAQRAGTSKAVLYRRWRNRLELVRAAIRDHRVFISNHIPNTGTLRGDVIALLTHTASSLGELPPDVIWGVMADVVSDPKLDVFTRNQVRKVNLQVMTEILQRAETRDEVNLSPLPKRVLTIQADLARHEMLVTGKPPTKAAIKQIVDDIFLPLVNKSAL